MSGAHDIRPAVFRFKALFGTGEVLRSEQRGRQSVDMMLDLLHPDARQPAEAETERTSAEDPVMIIHTSGTTGKPKGIVRDNGGNAVESDWTLIATGPTGFSGLGPTVDNGNSFDAGSYDLSESGPAYYSASAWVCASWTRPPTS